MLKVNVKKLKSGDNSYKLEVTGSLGAMLAIKHALEKHAESSPVAADVLSFLLVAADKSQVGL